MSKGKRVDEATKAEILQQLPLNRKKPRIG